MTEPGMLPPLVAAEPATDDQQSETLAMARQGGLNVVGALFNQSARLVVTLLLGRFLGTAAVGIYYQAFAFMALASFVAAAGFQTALVRFVAVHRSEKNDAALWGVIGPGILIPTGIGVVLGVALVLSAEWLGTVAFDDPGVITPIRFVGLALPAAVFADVALAATQGFKTMKPYVAIGLIFEPAFRLSLTLGLLLSGQGLVAAMIALAATQYIAAVLAGIALARRLGRRTVRPDYRLRELFSFSTLSWGSSIASNGLIWADTLLLGILGSSRDVGIYQVATRLVLLSWIFMQPINMAFAPRIADLYQRGMRDVLTRTFELTTTWTVRLSLPFIAVLVLWPDELLRLFGAHFVAGAGLTVLLACGSFLDVASGPSGYMLWMSGRAVLAFADNIAILVLNVGLNILLIPRYGILGAGMAWVLAIAVINSTKLIQVWMSFKMHPYGPGFFKAVGAGALALGVGALLRQQLHGGGGFVVGVVCLFLVYIGALIMAGISPDDRVIFTALRHRLMARGT